MDRQDAASRMSGITNSGDMVKVKDSNYVVTDVNEYTHYAQVSNRIDQSPNLPVTAISIDKQNFYQQKAQSGYATTKNGGTSPFSIENSKQINDKQSSKNNIINAQMTIVPSSSVFNYSLKSFQDHEDCDDDQEIQDSFGEAFNVMSKQQSSKFKDQEMEAAIYSNNSSVLNGGQIQNNMKQNPDHSLYSDDQKKSVFLYSSSNDDIVQSQISNRISNLLNHNQHSNRNSSKHTSIQFLSGVGSNTSVAFGGTQGQTQGFDGQQFMFKTQSSNFQLSDMTMSLLRDGSNINNFNGGLNNKNFLDTDAFEIKEEDDENCYTPLDQYNDHQSLATSLNHRTQDGRNLMQSNLGESQSQTEMMVSSQPQKDTQNEYQNMSQSEESFVQCDYDEYMEEKCSLQDNSEDHHNQLSQNTHYKDSEKSSPQNSYYKIKVQNMDGSNTQYNRSVCQSASIISATSSQGLPPKGPQNQTSDRKLASTIIQSDLSNEHGYYSLGSSIQPQQQLQQQQPPHSYYHLNQQNHNRQFSHINSQLSSNSNTYQQINYTNDIDAKQEMIQYLNGEDNEQYVVEEEDDTQQEGFIETFGAIDQEQQVVLSEEECEASESQQQEDTQYQEQQWEEQEKNNQIIQEEQEQVEQEEEEVSQHYQQIKEPGVVERLLYHQKQKQQKLEFKRIQRQNQELMSLQAKPQITQLSHQLTRHHEQPTYLDQNLQKDCQRRLESLKRSLDQQKLAEVTFKPQISQKGKSKSRRGVQDLYEWQNEQIKKKDEMKRQKEEKERKEIQEFANKQQKYMNKESLKYIANKENLYATQRIEERLISIGQQTKLKKEKLAISKDQELLQLANLHHPQLSKRDRTLSLSSNQQNNNYQSQQQSHSKKKPLQQKQSLNLQEIEQNKERKNLFKMYYNEKKKEAETKLLSTTALQSAFQISPSSKGSYDPNTISRNNLYQQTQSNNMMGSLTSQTNATTNPFITQDNMMMTGNNQFYPLSPQNPVYQSFQHGNTNSSQQLYFDLSNPNTYCSFGNMPTYHSMHQNQSQHSLSHGSNDVYQQLLRQASNHSQMMNIQKQSHLGNQPSIASTSCFEIQKCDNSQGSQEQIQLPPKSFNNTTKSNTTKQSSQVNSSRTQRFQQPTSSSRQRSKTRNDNSQPQKKTTNKVSSLSPKSNGSSQTRQGDNFYTKNLQWSKERQRKIEHQQDKLNLLNSLKCTFKPNISVNSHKLMSPSNLNDKSRLRIYEGNNQGNRPSNFNREMLFDQLMNSQLSPLKSCRLDSPQQQDPILEQFTQQQYDYGNNQLPSNNFLPIQMQMQTIKRQNLSHQYNLKTQRQQINNQLL